MFKIVQRKEPDNENIASKRGSSQNKQASPLLLKNEKTIKKSEPESTTIGSPLQNNSLKIMDTSIRLIDDSLEITDSLKVEKQINHFIIFYILGIYQ